MAPARPATPANTVIASAYPPSGRSAPCRYSSASDRTDSVTLVNRISSARPVLGQYPPIGSVHAGNRRLMTIQGSVWLATANLPQYGVLDADQTTDVVVVGGGLVGLTTALHLQQEGLAVILLEAGRIGSRTSGGTTGKVTSQHGAIYTGLVERHGPEKAEQYATANQEAVDEVAGVARWLEIGCELRGAPSSRASAAPPPPPPPRPPPPRSGARRRRPRGSVCRPTSLIPLSWSYR